MRYQSLILMTLSLLYKVCVCLPTFEKDQRFDGKLCFPISHDFEEVSRTLYCAVLCESNSGCHGFFHSASQKKCFGINSLPSLATICSDNSTFKLYRKTACSEPPTYANAVVESGNRIARQFTCGDTYTKAVPEIQCHVDPTSGTGAWEPTTDICIDIYGSSCTTDAECAEINGTCISNTCLCDVNKPYDAVTKKCKSKFKLVPGNGGNGYNTGQLHMLHVGQWSNVCFEHWSWTATKAACQDIDDNFIYGGAWHDRDVYGEGLPATPSYKLKNLDCGTSGVATSIADCTLEVIETGCGHDKDIGLTCYDTNITDSVRLNPSYTKDGVDSEHRFEVFYNDTWGTVCENGWSSTESDTACRSIDPTKPYKDNECKDSCAGGPAGPYMVNDVKCSGNEPHVFFCQNGGWKDSHSCPGKEVGLICKV